MPASNKWTSEHDKLLPGPIAFFSMEFAIHSSLPIYAGGLGVLAGDICKEASDIGLPMVAVGFMYPQGYFLLQIDVIIMPFENRMFLYIQDNIEISR